MTEPSENGQRRADTATAARAEREARAARIARQAGEDPDRALQASSVEQLWTPPDDVAPTRRMERVQPVVYDALGKPVDPAAPDGPDQAAENPDAQDDEDDGWGVSPSQLAHAVVAGLSAERTRRGLRKALLRRSVIAGVVAVAALIVSYDFGGVLGSGRHHTLEELMAYGGALVFLASAVIAVRGATDDLLAGVPKRIGDGRTGTLRIACILSGYALVALCSLSLLHVPVSRLLLGGVLTGVILGIAAQQALGNTFAGMVLMFARPFSLGDKVTIRSGSLGGVVIGVVTGVTFTYVSVRTEEGLVLLPNAAVLNAAIGPAAQWQG